MSFGAPMGGSASPGLRCAMGGFSVGTILMKSAAGNKPRAASIAVLTGSAVSQRNSCVMERETVWMVRTKWAVVSPPQVLVSAAIICKKALRVCEVTNQITNSVPVNEHDPSSDLSADKSRKR